MAGAKRTEIMKVSLDALWEAITDYEKYPEFVDGCAAINLKSRKGNTAIVEYTVNKLKTFSYTLELKETPKKRVQWKMIEGEFFKSNDGSWNIKVLDDDELEVTYELEVGMPALVPKMIVNGLVSNSLPEMLAGFEARAKKLQKKQKTKAGKK